MPRSPRAHAGGGRALPGLRASARVQRASARVQRAGRGVARQPLRAAGAAAGSARARGTLSRSAGRTRARPSLGPRKQEAFQEDVLGSAPFGGLEESSRGGGRAEFGCDAVSRKAQPSPEDALSTAGSSESPRNWGKGARPLYPSVHQSLDEGCPGQGGSLSEGHSPRRWRASLARVPEG